MKGFKSLLSVALVAVAGVFGLVACDKNANDAYVPSPFVANEVVATTDSEEYDSNEIFDDNENGQARLAAIDTAVQVKVQIKVTNACSSTGSAGFKYKEGNVTTTAVSGTAAGTAQGFKSFSVQRTKFNTALLKTFDKTKSYTIYAKVPGVPGKKAVAATPTSASIAAVAAIPISYRRVLVLPANPAAAKKLNAKGKPIGRPITTAVTDLGCPS